MFISARSFSSQVIGTSTHTLILSLHVGFGDDVEQPYGRFLTARVAGLHDRVDVAVRCVIAGDFELSIESERSIDTTMPLAALYVEGGSNGVEDDLETWTPCRYMPVAPIG